MNKNRSTKSVRGTRIYTIWINMRARCNNKNHMYYKNYGGRGISVCLDWDDFWVFHRDMIDGYSDDLSIDRIDNNKGYSKHNCRWATRQQQQWNSSRKGSRSKYRGVSFSQGKYTASINNKYIGRFSSEIDAALAYDKESRIIYGEKAMINILSSAEGAE